MVDVNPLNFSDYSIGWVVSIVKRTHYSRGYHFHGDLVVVMPKRHQFLDVGMFGTLCVMQCDGSARVVSLHCLWLWLPYYHTNSCSGDHRRYSAIMPRTDLVPLSLTNRHTTTMKLWSQSVAVVALDVVSCCSDL